MHNQSDIQLASHRIQTPFVFTYHDEVFLRKSLEDVKPPQILWGLFSETEIISAQFRSLSLTLVNKATSRHISMPVSSLLLLKVFFVSLPVPLTTSGLFVLPLLIFHCFKPPACR